MYMILAQQEGKFPHQYLPESGRLVERRAKSIVWIERIAKTG